MNNESSIAKIYWTEDFSLFHFLHGNRDLNPAKIKKLIKDVQEGLDLFQYCPILVNKDYYIIDGQHRFYVCKKLGIKIYYCIVPDFTLAQIAKVNNNQNRWKNTDFLNCYIDAGKNSEHYKTLKQFSEKYKLMLSCCISLLHTGFTGGNSAMMDIFREGEFEVKYLDESTKLLETAREYASFTAVYNSRNFLTALKRLLESDKFSHSRMLEKLRKNNLQISKCPGPKEYLAHMEELFNFKNSKRKTIY